jgi:hypothetical protein
MMRINHVIAVLTLGIAVGWFSAVETQQGQPETQSPRHSPRERTRPGNLDKDSAPAAAAAWLAPVQNASSPIERLRAVLHLAHTLPISEIHRWHDSEWLKPQLGGAFEIFWKITTDRWLAENPTEILQHAFKVAKYDIGELAARWARTDPTAAVAYLKSVQDKGKLKLLETPMLIHLAESLPDEVIGMARTSVKEVDFDPSNWERILESLANHHPGLLQTAELPKVLKSNANAILARNRLTEDFAVEIARLLESPTGRTDFSAIFSLSHLPDTFIRQLPTRLSKLPTDWNREIGGKLSSILTRNPELWIHHDFQALGMTKSDAKNLLETAWQHLAWKKPKLFLADFANQDGIAASEYSSSLLTALKCLHDNSPEEAASWIAEHGSRITDEAIKSRIDELLSPREEQQSQTPTRTLLDFLTNDSLKIDSTFDPHALTNLDHESLAYQKEIADAVSAMPIGKQSEIGYASLDYLEGGGLRSIQADLLAAMISAPPVHVTTDQKSSIIYRTSVMVHQWVQDDALQAGRWSSQLPQGDARKWALRNVASSWMPNDPTGAMAWVERLPPADRTDIKEFLNETSTARSD